MELVFKVLVLGAPGTGKTSIIRRSVANDYTDLYQPTLGVDFHFKKIQEKGQDVVLQLWDIAGQDRFGAIYRVYYRDAYGALVVFDLSDEESSLESAAKWKKEIDDKVTLPNNKPLPVMLLANKCDLDVSIHKDKLDKFCADHGFVGWFETSAKENINVEESIRRLVGEILNHDDAFEAQRQAAEASQSDVDIKADQTASSSSGGCC